MNYKRAVAGGRTAGRSLSALPSGSDVIGHRLLCRRRLYATVTGAAVARTGSTFSPQLRTFTVRQKCVQHRVVSGIKYPESE